MPVIASLSASAAGDLLNVNADTLAADVAARLGAARLVIAGATPGVLDTAGATLPVVDRAMARRMVASGEASAGMVAKLAACRESRQGWRRRCPDRRWPHAGRSHRRAGRRPGAGFLDPHQVRTPVMTATDIQSLEARHVLQTYKRQPVVFVAATACA